MVEAHIHKSAGIIIKDRKLLVEKSKNKDFFIAPGGSIEEDETPEEALVRELMEEFSIKVQVEDLEKYGDFYAEAAGQPGRQVHMVAFIVKNWEGEPVATSEVEKILWLTSDVPAYIQVGSIFEHQVIPKLKEEGLID